MVFSKTEETNWPLPVRDRGGAAGAVAGLPKFIPRGLVEGEGGGESSESAPPAPRAPGGRGSL